MLYVKVAKGALSQLQELQDTRAQHRQDFFGTHRELEELQQSQQSVYEVNWQASVSVLLLI